MVLKILPVHNKRIASNSCWNFEIKHFYIAITITGEDKKNIILSQWLHVTSDFACTLLLVQPIWRIGEIDAKVDVLIILFNLR